MQAKSRNRRSMRRDEGNALVALLNEERLAQLVATHKRLHRAEAAEQILNFPVLVDLLRLTQSSRGNDLQRTGIRDPIALKAFRLFTVEKRKHGSAGTQQLREVGHGLP